MPVRVLSAQKVIGDVTVTVSRVKKVDSAAERLEAFLKWLSEKLSNPVDPEYGVEAPPAAPDQGLPPGQPGTPTHPIAPGGSPGTPTHPIAPVLGENAKEIAKAILKNTLCDPDRPQPK